MGEFNLDEEVSSLALEDVSFRPTFGMGKTIAYMMSQATLSSSTCEGLCTSKGRGVSIRATSSATSSHQSIDLTINIRNAGVVTMLFRSLKEDDPNQVKATAASAPNVYEFIQSIGGDLSRLQNIVDAYVQSVKTLLELQRISLEVGASLWPMLPRLQATFSLLKRL